jgi:D-3-phosphoglycerate dehydrogenase / 2-oxoglutarate reductase
VLVWAPDWMSEAADRILFDAGHYVLNHHECRPKPQAIWTRCMDATGELLLSSVECNLIACPATGTDHLDWARARGARVLSLRDCGDLSSIRATVEHTIGLILSLTRRIPSAVESVRRGEWDRMRFQGTDLADKTVAVIGVGRIGKQVSDILQHGFGMGPLWFDPAWNVQQSLPEFLSIADLVTVHVSLNESSRGMFGPAEFAAMKPGAYFVNTSRGAVVDEAALLDALKSGHLSGAALDVLCDEPPKPDNPLVEFAREQPERLILTPHLGGCTVESMERAEVLLARKLVEVLDGGS